MMLMNLLGILVGEEFPLLWVQRLVVLGAHYCGCEYLYEKCLGKKIFRVVISHNNESAAHLYMHSQCNTLP